MNLLKSSLTLSGRLAKNTKYSINNPKNVETNTWLK